MTRRNPPQLTPESDDIGVPHSRSGKRVRQLAAGTAAAAAVSLAPGTTNSASAAIIHFDNSNAFSVTNNDFVNWDVDGMGSADFAVRGFNNPGNRTLMFSSLGLDGRGWVRRTTQTSSNIQALTPGLNIGPALAPGYAFGISTTDQVVSLDGAFLQVNGFTDGVDGLAGFQFEISGDTHYGWARVNFALGTPGVSNGVLEVVEWAFEDAADTAIAAGATGGQAVPEPASSAVLGGLALLACGAGGVKRWRQSKKSS